MNVEMTLVKQVRSKVQRSKVPYILLWTSQAHCMTQNDLGTKKIKIHHIHESPRRPKFFSISLYGQSFSK